MNSPGVAIGGHGEDVRVAEEIDDHPWENDDAEGIEAVDEGDEHPWDADGMAPTGTASTLLVVLWNLLY